MESCSAMKEIFILQHAAHEAPGFFAELLHQHGLAFRVLHLYAGESLPRGVDAMRGLIMMGGPMSVNDEAIYPWLVPEMMLIRQAVAAGIPTLGHCLGGQLVSKALGGVVSRNQVQEVGWHEVEKVASAAYTPWLENLPDRFSAFHWHGETFSLPPGAVHLLRNAHCEHQAFAIGAHVLGFQCHPEMTQDMVMQWTEVMGDDLLRASDSVQDAESIRHDLPDKIRRLNAVARWLYRPWFAQILLP